MKHALTIGTFDCPHLGHALLVKRCYELADEVTVAVNSSRFVKQYKGVDTVFSDSERMHFMGLLADNVVLNDGAGREVIWSSVDDVDVLVIGGDWLEKDYLAQIEMEPHELQSLGIALAYVPYTEGISTTLLKERLGAGDPPLALCPRCVEAESPAWRP